MNRDVFRALASAIDALIGMAAFCIAYVHARIAFAWFRWRLGSLR